MIIDISKNTYVRGFTFELIAKKILRRENKNAFIFLTTEFKDIEEFFSYYRINTNSVTNLETLSKYIKYLDVIEIKLDSVEHRNVQEITLYEVKSKIDHRKRPVDMSKNFYKTCSLLKEKGFTIKLIYIQMFENWRFSINIYDFFKFKNFTLREKREILSP